MSPEPSTSKRFDKHASASFGLAMFLLVLPVMADIATGLMFGRFYWAVALWMTSCYLLVVVPWVSSLLRHWREPGVWRGRGYLIGTGIILGLHAMALVAAAIEWVRNGAP